MDRIGKQLCIRMVLLIGAFLLFFGTSAQGAIVGINGQKFTLVAKQDTIVTSDGDSTIIWGYAVVNEATGQVGRAQYPGPTLIVTEDVPVTITLTNELPDESGNVSMVFLGQQNVSAAGGVEGLMTREAVQYHIKPVIPEEKVVTYTFTPTEPGTYLYRSGTWPDLHVEMGLFGALIVRPAATPEGGDPTKHYAYNHVDTEYDREFLYLLSEMDPRIHRQVEENNGTSLILPHIFPPTGL
jgi:FtsP/CotA-like multicopper oxidase with cupredoxin domain